MSRQIALLRAVNVGGTGLVPMAKLREVAEAAGLTNVRTLLQSGNLVFEAGKKKADAVEALLEKACAKAFGLDTTIYVRAAAELDAIIAANPFPKEAKDDPGHLHVMFLRDVPPANAFKELQAAIKGRERVHGAGRHAYIVYPDGAGNSKLTTAVVKRHLQTTGTARNWNTLLKLAAALAQGD
jgi:uncharacterized protein (DUF1697 family)